MASKPVLQTDMRITGDNGKTVSIGNKAAKEPATKQQTQNNSTK